MRTDPGGPATTRTVALLHYTAPPVVGGVEQVLGHHARLLADAGHTVRIVAGRGAQPDERIAFVSLPRADTRHPAIVDLRVDLDAGRIPPSFARIVAELADELEAALAGVDVVIAHNVCSLNLNLALTAALEAVAGRTPGRRLVLWHHDLAWKLPTYRSTLHPGPPWDLLRRAWPRATQVAISEGRRSDVADLMEIDAAAVRVVPNGVDLQPLLGLAPGTMEVVHATGLLALDPLMLLPARITPRKNIELALRVVAEMRATGREAAGAVITGPADPHEPAGGGYLGALLELRHDLGLDASAIFLAELPGELSGVQLVHDLYRLADMLFLPSRDEGFGIPILEAAAHRLPILCSDLPILRDLAGDAALYVAPDADPAAVAALALARLDGDALVRLARRVRTEFSWEAVYGRGIAPLVDD